MRVAITADSASIPASHKRDAEAFARECGFRHEFIETHEFENPGLRQERSRIAASIARTNCSRVWKQFGRERGFEHIVYGVNKDDLGDYRPGQNARAKHHR